MPPVDVPWPLGASPGQRPGEGEGDLINTFATVENGAVKWRRVAGLESEFQVAERNPRGLLATQIGLVNAWEGGLYIWNAGVNTPVIDGDSLVGTGPLTMAANLLTPNPDVVIVDPEAGAFQLDIPSNTLITYPDGDVGAVTSVEHFSGYFFFTRLSGEIIASELRQVDINPLSIARAEYADDYLLRVKNNGGTLLAMGERTIEVWQDVGASPFPLVRSQAIDVGLLAMWCVAGGANEWEHGVTFVASDYTVRTMRGYDAVPISTEAVSRDIYDYRGSADEIRCFVYGFGPHQIFTIWTPDWCWEFNAASAKWHRRRSYTRQTWRGNWSAYWSRRWFVQDRLDGHVAEVIQDLPTEIGDKLPALIESGPIKEFPASFRIPQIDVDLSTGVGSPELAELDPAVLLSWSHDGGATWSNPLIRSMGAPGEFSKRVSYRNLGRSTHQGVRLRLEVPDPVPLVLTKAVSTRTQGSRPRQVA